MSDGYKMPPTLDLRKKKPEIDPSADDLVGEEDWEIFDYMAEDVFKTNNIFFS